MTEKELETEIAALEKVATQLPSRNAGRILMKVAAYKIALLKLKNAPELTEALSFLQPAEGSKGRSREKLRGVFKLQLRESIRGSL